MRKLIYSMLMSLDGFVEGPNRELDWHVIDEELHTFVNDQERERGTYLYGRRMYETMTAYWPTADVDPANPDYIVEFASIWKSKPKVVFSKSLERVEWNARLVRDNISGEVARLKEQPGGDLSVGGAAIAAELVRLGLVDEFQVYIHPVVLGGGKSMFPVLDERIRLRLAASKRFESGVVFLRYLRAGEG